MRKIKVLNVMGKKSYEIDGKQYNSFDELPEDCKKLLEDKNHNGIPDSIEKSKVTVERKTYNNIDEMPKELQEKIKKEFTSITKKELSASENTNTSQGYFQPKEQVIQYCDNCGNVLPDKSFLGYVKCESCGKRMKKKREF